MKKYLILFIWFIGIQISAQDLMRVTTQNGTQYEFSINNIKEMDFYVLEQINFVGEWIFISGDIAMISYDLKSDGTLKYTYFSMGAVNQIDEKYGTYAVKDNVLTLNYDNSTLVVPVVEATETKIVSSSGETFYKVQETDYSLSTIDEPIHVGNEGDVIKFVDKCIVGTENNLIKPLRSGRGYAIVEEKETGIMKAFGIDVLYVPESPMDWTRYFKKTKDEIMLELGTPPYTESFRYTDFNASIQYIAFSFDEETGEAVKVQVGFYDEEKRQHYCDYIEDTYVLNKTTSSSKTYYDAEEPNSANVKVTVYDASVMCTIVYTDLKTTPVSTIDWTQYFRKSGDQIKTEFGSNPDVTDDDEYEDYSMVYYSVNGLKYISFTFDKGFENVTNIMVSFSDANSMQNYCDYIATKYIFDTDRSSETLKVYYDTDSQSTASVRIRINTSKNYISYSDLSE